MSLFLIQVAIEALTIMPQVGFLFIEGCIRSIWVKNIPTMSKRHFHYSQRSCWKPVTLCQR